jgi:multicomponent Na+:H+ antiporter subunit D
VVRAAERGSLRAAAYRPEERGSIQGALNFAITNSIGAYLTLSGIAVVYGRTGALNMAQIGQDLARHRPDGLVGVACLGCALAFSIRGSLDSTPRDGYHRST